jgi:hypothetical protein
MEGATAESNTPIRGRRGVDGKAFMSIGGWRKAAGCFESVESEMGGSAGRQAYTKTDATRWIASVQFLRRRRRCD